MSVQEVKAAVEAMDPSERRSLTAWMLRRYPPLRIEDLMDFARRQMKSGQWMPSPPDEENIPSGEARIHAADTVRRLGLGAEPSQ